jgi:hypothetical protein
VFHEKHFTVDGMLIQARASRRGFRSKGGSDDGYRTNLHGYSRSIETHESTTDVDARQHRKKLFASAGKSTAQMDGSELPSYLGALRPHLAVFKGFIHFARLLIVVRHLCTSAKALTRSVDHNSGKGIVSGAMRLFKSCC